MEVAFWNQHRFEVPDPIAFADYTFSKDEIVRGLTGNKRLSHSPEPLHLFPYPKSKKKIRHLALLTPIDLAILRFAAGGIVERVDDVLSPNVFSYRLACVTPVWQFRTRARAWKDFTREGIEIIRSKKYAGMCRTDVKSYYPSVSLSILQKRLEQIGCNGDCVAVLARFLVRYNKQVPGLGLPIGPEACAVLGNAFLTPLDERLFALDALHLRYGDDVLLFARKDSDYDDLLLEIDDQLSALRLDRSREKTVIFDDSDKAIENLKSGRIDYLGHLLNVDPAYGIASVRWDFEEQVNETEDPDPSKFRWLVKTLQHKADNYACGSLADSPQKMNIDPKVTSDYLAVTGLDDDRVVNGIMNRLTSRTAEEYEGLDLHLLRAATTRAFGDAEAKEFKRIAVDDSRRFPIRNWAWKAYAKSSPRFTELAEAARAEHDPEVRRGIIVSMRGFTDPRFLDHVRQNFPESRYAANWLAAA